jgi:hypothetical protein
MSGELGEAGARDQGPEYKIFDRVIPKGKGIEKFDKKLDCATHSRL